MKKLKFLVILFITGAFLVAPAVVSAQSENKAAIEWYNKGNNEKDPNKMIEYFTKAISIDPNYVNAYSKRGIAYGMLERYNEAIADFTKAISIDPNCKWAYFGRGYAYTCLEKYNEAIADYTKAISIDPNYVDVFYYRGLNYKALGENEKAHADFRKACDGGFEEACEELKK